MVFNALVDVSQLSLFLLVSVQYTTDDFLLIKTTLKAMITLQTFAKLKANKNN